jgi:hypothetical protein
MCPASCTTWARRGRTQRVSVPVTPFRDSLVDRSGGVTFTLELDHQQAPEGHPMEAHGGHRHDEAKD